MFFLYEETKETVVGFLQQTVRVLEIHNPKFILVWYNVGRK